jgi:hypothetical protein
MYVSGNLLCDGRVILEGIAGHLWDHAGPAGRRFWSGEFAVPPGRPLPPGDYQLVLDDGWAGDIQITWVSAAGALATAVANFILAGPLP